ncbi:MAG: FAD-dependent monooxygenase [Arthrobacter sp.]|uniref:FAD-dependent monooxygenase n=1 Tax=Arthrobacter TaxID=1663 RepID=UPI00264D5C1C|nr:FAD-dependent monooxygenase [Micrococcaceae bacterium]MDN5812575.1 FAD-dependent monooxygenase [Micrococcaceae bacterium]MDN5877939.1 FAD-dependent monooxygenase [Micrococcaceae bacterium]MDN5886506.1 FAD-dependent monooxygenase [Micrococcaceae bacterium]MDN5904651.1 FAD-dependent monooxygenase [Micrococcaceae bacterium]
METDQRTVDVCVVGAGPTGLMAANWLERLGVEAVIIDGKAGPTRESRALGVQARTMEIYAQLGVVDQVLAQAVPANEMRPGVGRSSWHPVPLDRIGQGLTPYPGITILEQHANEEILASRLASRGRAVAWNTKLLGLRQDGDGVDLDVESADGPRQTIRARYVVAADGASSPTRGQLGIGFEGETNEKVFYVIDAHDVHGTGSGINVRLAGDDFLLTFPMSDPSPDARRVRLLGILREAAGARSSTAHAASGDQVGVDEQRARGALEQDFGVSYSQAGWFATYRVHHRVADAFRAGRVFLAGDAGHVHSPVGAQGMNTGLQDAHNLACKLADVLSGRMPESYLERYEAERRPVARRLVATTDRLFSRVTSSTARARFIRSRVMPLLWPVLVRVAPRGPLGTRIFGYVSQLRIHYWMTEQERTRAEARHGVARIRRRDPVVGRRLPWIGATNPGEDNHAPLASARWQVHAYGARAAGRGAITAQQHGVELHLFGASPRRGLPDGTVVVVRPDGFVAVRHRVRAHRREA